MSLYITVLEMNSVFLHNNRERNTVFLITILETMAVFVYNNRKNIGVFVNIHSGKERIT
jgi:hypothetical protein